MASEAGLVSSMGLDCQGGPLPTGGGTWIGTRSDFADLLSSQRLVYHPTTISSPHLWAYILLLEAFLSLHYNGRPTKLCLAHFRRKSWRCPSCQRHTMSPRQSLWRLRIHPEHHKVCSDQTSKCVLPSLWCEILKAGFQKCLSISSRHASIAMLLNLAWRVSFEWLTKSMCGKTQNGGSWILFDHFAKGMGREKTRNKRLSEAR